MSSSLLSEVRQTNPPRVKGALIGLNLMQIVMVLAYPKLSTSMIKYFYKYALLLTQFYGLPLVTF